MGFVLEGVRERRRLWREQHIHLLSLTWRRGNPKCPGQRRDPVEMSREKMGPTTVNEIQGQQAVGIIQWKGER